MIPLRFVSRVQRFSVEGDSSLSIRLRDTERVPDPREPDGVSLREGSDVKESVDFPNLPGPAHYLLVEPGAA